MLNGLVDSWRVTPFNHPKPIVCRYQSTNLTQFIGSTARLRKVALKARLQLCVGEIHDGQVFQRSAAQWLTGFEDYRRGRGDDWDHCLMIDLWVLLIQFCGQTLGLFLFEECRPGSERSGADARPMDRVGFHGALLGWAIHSFSGRPATRHSVVSNSPAIDEAFCRAARVTFVGSTTPALTKSSYSLVATL